MQESHLRLTPGGQSTNIAAKTLQIFKNFPEFKPEVIPS